ncbi:unnamed protein product [Lactuca virosa]|uniref:Uncharacterized protein n=1 Tax=Lactuca virosa TaxID=75947 RepID=A0AAU9LTA6_9ASTR|nr:unnamed protein product [Lactuca virosa]
MLFLISEDDKDHQISAFPFDCHHSSTLCPLLPPPRAFSVASLPVEAGVAHRCWSRKTTAMSLVVAEDEDGRRRSSFRRKWRETNRQRHCHRYLRPMAPPQPSRGLFHRFLSDCHAPARGWLCLDAFPV